MAEPGPSPYWQQLMAFAFGPLRLPPDVFWTMTLKEFRALAGPWLRAVPQRLDRAAMAELMARFPDNSKSGKD